MREKMRSEEILMVLSSILVHLFFHLHASNIDSDKRKKTRPKGIVQNVKHITLAINQT